MTSAENEQELVLGNKQLLSAFFVVVALLGVFFTMGYIIGRNAAAPVDARSAVRTVKPVETAPAAETAAPAAKPAATETAPAEAAQTESAEEAPRTAAAAPPSGRTYLQVMAVKRPVGDNTVRILKERGFPALLGESSKPELFRVLVGPYGDTPSLAKAKSELKGMGFEPVIVK